MKIVGSLADDCLVSRRCSHALGVTNLVTSHNRDMHKYLGIVMLLSCLGTSFGCGSDDVNAVSPEDALPLFSAGSGSSETTEMRPSVVDLKPGPELLYLAPPRSPQLENTGIWRADPILVSGTSAYREGEFLYQDYLYDDLGAGPYTYPTNDAAYVRNVADLVELRVKPLESELAIRITYNSMTDPALVGTTLALGTSAEPRAFPHGANVSAPAQVFVSVWGDTGDVINAATGQIIGVPSVEVDRLRRQVEVRVSYAYYDPRALRDARIAAGVGLWDKATHNYLIPQDTADATHPGGAGELAVAPPAFFNVAFRYLQQSGGDFRTEAQATALKARDISEFSGSIDFMKLAEGMNDDLVDTAVGTPSSGWANRIFASHFEKQQGRILTGSRASECALERPCDPTYAGQLQPYSIYIPNTEQQSAEGYGLTFDLHAAGGSHNSNNGSASIAPTRQISFGERGDGNIVVTALARGTDLWYYGYGLADVFEVWADVARHYKIDPSKVVSTGISMGGFGSYKLSTMFPDLFAAIGTSIGCPTAGTRMSAPDDFPGGPESAILPRLDNLRHVPASIWVGDQDATCSYVNGQRPIGDRMKALNYRYEFRTFEGMGHANPPSFQDQADYLGFRTAVVNPAHITYVRNVDIDEPDFSIVADHVYWISDIKLRDTSSTKQGMLDVVSGGLGTVDAAPNELVTGSGEVTATFFPYVTESRDWGSDLAQPAKNELHIQAKNIASIVIDGTRAKVDCDVEIDLDSDGATSVEIAGCP